ncbi:AAA family ATPase [Candidatus Phytoplasma solani]|uniref:AAA family ATPase n=1 Tax=Candidatus Phytoplasma solani TaxID=69896 RepID=UPI00358EB79B
MRNKSTKKTTKLEETKTPKEEKTTKSTKLVDKPKEKTAVKDEPVTITETTTVTTITKPFSQINTVLAASQKPKENNNVFLFLVFLFLLVFGSLLLTLYAYMSIGKQIKENKLQSNDQLEEQIKDLENSVKGIKDLEIPEEDIKKIIKETIKENKSTESVNSTDKNDDDQNKQPQMNDVPTPDSQSQQESKVQEENLLISEQFGFKEQSYKNFPNFKDLVGLTQAKENVKPFLNYIKYPEVYDNRGKVGLPTGMMMYGTPGCGKTVFAGSVAQEAKMNLIEVQAADFSQKYVGDGPQMVKELFAFAREVAKRRGGVILFIDECENVFLSPEGINNGSDINNVVNQFKVELEPRQDEKGPQPRIFVMGATNNFSKIDEAIMSRFTLKLELMPGNLEEREQQLKFIVESNKHPITKEAKQYLLKTINKALDNLPPPRGENNNTKHYKKAYRVLSKLVETANNISIGRNINALNDLEERKKRGDNSVTELKCNLPNHETDYQNNEKFKSHNKGQISLSKDDLVKTLENCCACEAIDIVDLMQAYRDIIDPSLETLKSVDPNWDTNFSALKQRKKD